MLALAPLPSCLPAPAPPFAGRVLKAAASTHVATEAMEARPAATQVDYAPVAAPVAAPTTDPAPAKTPSSSRTAATEVKPRACIACAGGHTRPAALG